MSNCGVVKMTDGDIWLVFPPPVRSPRRKEGVIKLAGSYLLQRKSPQAVSKSAGATRGGGGRGSGESERE